jgi:hypothetical protein
VKIFEVLTLNIRTVISNVNTCNKIKYEVRFYKNVATAEISKYPRASSSTKERYIQQQKLFYKVYTRPIFMIGRQHEYKQTKLSASKYILVLSLLILLLLPSAQFIVMIFLFLILLIFSWLSEPLKWAFFLCRIYQLSFICTVRATELYQAWKSS